jgi:uncharacterized protein
MPDQGSAFTDNHNADILVPAKAPEGFGYPGINERREIADGLAIERDLPVPMRDGAIIRADLYRAESQPGPLPVLVIWSPYGKHSPVTWDMFDGSEVDIASLSRHTLVECPDPVVWCARGYALLIADPRGTWGSEGDFSIQSPQEREDLFDIIEWAAAQAWSDGNIGMAGMSYFSWSQWQAASMAPPHLKAIQPYDGATDAYREIAFHGGIPNDQFMEAWNGGKTMWGRGLTEDWRLALDKHPLLDDFWQSKQPDLETIEIPAYVVTSWTDHGIHTRGTLEGFMRIGSRHKFLEAHGRKKWSRYYWPESVDRQLAFFDRFLKGIPNQVDQWPAVRVEVRERYYEGRWRDEEAWPLPGTEYVPYFLDAAAGSLTRTRPADVSHLAYDSTQPGAAARFDLTFTEDTEITGYAMTKLWISLNGADDGDLFVALQKVDASGKLVNFPYFTLQNDGQAAHGWQRISHRELATRPDARRERIPGQPIHPHQRELPVAEGEIVDVSVELWPSSTLFRAGESLRLLIQGTDIQSYPARTFVAGHHLLRNSGPHTLHTGGRFDAHLLLPVIRPTG